MTLRQIFKVLVLWPISRMYGLGVAVRNKMFDMGVLSQREFDIPVIVVGNIAVGGTGKTPHSEYIVGALKDEYKIGVLSRGYRRRTHGFLLATPDSHPDDIGDEPYQIYRRFAPDVVVAVCEDRVKGIEQMRRHHPELNMIVLDDAFQHRYVKPTLSIVLTEYSRPPYADTYLPYGRLREPMSALNRAEAVVVTKCPDTAQPIDFRVLREHLNLFPYQKLIFSRYAYRQLRPVFPDSAPRELPRLSSYGPGDMVVSLTGVANPRPFLRYIRKRGTKVKVLRFDDHHRFTASDMEALRRKFKTIAGSPRAIILTTEKDAVRLAACPYFPHELRDKTFFIPIEVEELQQSDDSIPSLIRQAIRANH
ncbi:MAG: tetraacyldisaccharide 4'-kinase [Pseudoflavonifractor sp.]|nr:tetraacyldisaccharide 4'-kinase [Alloprevotella sp.]MCM1116769.1 tetraacyldisaccharide 4'-kinase [Pseudoflavonifractor sp.]